jgi:hypothetical protein
MKLIQTVTVGSGGAASIEFTSIPATYTDLLIVTSLRSTRSANQDPINYKFNNSSSNYTYRQLYGGAGSGSIVTGSASGSVGFLGIAPAANNTASTFGSQNFYITNYASAVAKLVSSDSVAENNATTHFQIDLVTVLWNDTAAISTISLFSENSANLAQYSSASLYGILKGSDGIVTVS